MAYLLLIKGPNNWAGRGPMQSLHATEGEAEQAAARVRRTELGYLHRYRSPGPGRGHRSSVLRRRQRELQIVEVPDAKWTTLYRAWFETRNFTFEAYGTSERHVRELLAAAWAKHAKQSGADPESPACASAVETLWGRYRLAQRKTISRAGWPSACPGAMSAVRRDRQQDTGTLRPRA